MEVDRERRERAWHFEMERRLRDRPAINDQWYKLLELRGKLAANAGMPGYRTYRWQQMLRFDSTPEDCYRFHDAIELDCRTGRPANLRASQATSGPD